MPLYVISYDLRKQRNYDSLLKTLRDAGAVRMLASLWLANLTGDAAQVRDVLRLHMDADDGLGLIELKAGSDWATYKVQPGAKEWLQRNVKP